MRRGRADLPCRVRRGDRAARRRCAAESRAFEVLAERAPARRGRRVLCCSRGRPGAAGMAGGQAIDLDATGQALDERGLATMHRHEDRRADPPRRCAWARRPVAVLAPRRARALDAYATPPASRSRWSTTCSTSKARRRRSARPRARTPRRASRPTCRCSASRRRARRRRAGRPGARSRWPRSARAARRLARDRGQHRPCARADHDRRCSTASPRPPTCASSTAPSCRSSRASCARSCSRRSPRPAATWRRTSAPSS